MLEGFVNNFNGLLSVHAVRLDLIDSVVVEPGAGDSTHEVKQERTVLGVLLGHFVDFARPGTDCDGRFCEAIAGSEVAAGTSGDWKQLGRNRDERGSLIVEDLSGFGTRPIREVLVDEFVVIEQVFDFEVSADDGLLRVGFDTLAGDVGSTKHGVESNQLVVAEATRVGCVRRGRKANCLVDGEVGIVGNLRRTIGGTREGNSAQAGDNGKVGVTLTAGHLRCDAIRGGISDLAEALVVKLINPFVVCPVVAGVVGVRVCHLQPPLAADRLSRVGIVPAARTLRTGRFAADLEPETGFRDTVELAVVASNARFHLLEFLHDLPFICKRIMLGNSTHFFSN